MNHTEPPADPDNMTPRERFNAVMAMIHPILKERTVRRFEEKLWEFLDIVFLCAKESAELCESLKEELEKLFHECRILHSRLCTAEGDKEKTRLCVGDPKASKHHDCPNKYAASRLRCEETNP